MFVMNNNITIETLKYHLQFIKEYEMISKKAKQIKNIPFRFKKYDTKEECKEKIKEITLLECIFSYQMYIIEKDFKDTSKENIEKQLVYTFENPVEKMNRIYNLTIILDDALTY